MKREAIVSFLIQEMAEEMPFVMRALPDENVWSAIVAGLVRDEDPDELAPEIDESRAYDAADADWKEIYGELRGMINEWPGEAAALAA